MNTPSKCTKHIQCILHNATDPGQTLVLRVFYPGVNPTIMQYRLWPDERKTVDLQPEQGKTLLLFQHPARPTRHIAYCIAKEHDLEHNILITITGQLRRNSELKLESGETPDTMTVYTREPGEYDYRGQLVLDV